MFKLFSKKPPPPPAGDWKMFDEFACICAEQALQAMREAGHEPDQRCVDAVEVLRRWLTGEATELELTAAENNVSSIKTEIEDTQDAHMEKLKANHRPSYSWQRRCCLHPTQYVIFTSPLGSLIDSTNSLYLLVDVTVVFVVTGALFMLPRPARPESLRTMSAGYEDVSLDFCVDLVFMA